MFIETPRGRYSKIVERHGQMPPQHPDRDENGEDFDDDFEFEDEDEDEEE